MLLGSQMFSEDAHDSLCIDYGLFKLMTIILFGVFFPPEFQNRIFGLFKKINRYYNSQTESSDSLCIE